jgi:hypothetical protein
MTFEYLKLKYQGATRAHYSQVEPWCTEHVGQYGHDWTRVGADIAVMMTAPSYEENYYFREESMLTMFLLRWS